MYRHRYQEYELESPACESEYGWAHDFGKPILPVLVSEGEAVNLLPPELSKIQHVDYRQQDRGAGIRLSRALNIDQPVGPLPDPLPPLPEAAISYLGGLSRPFSLTEPAQ